MSSDPLDPHTFVSILSSGGNKQFIPIQYYFIDTVHVNDSQYFRQLWSNMKYCILDDEVINLQQTVIDSEEL